MNESALRAVAEQAGIEPHWRDAFGQEREVPGDVLRRVLDTLGADGRAPKRPPLVTGLVGDWTPVGMGGGYRLVLEDGTATEGRLDDGAWLPPIGQPGYHTLEIAGGHTTLAIAPRRCFGLHDAMPGARPWGMTVQLYGLRRAGDGGIGDFAGLSQFVRAAGERGAATVAISPAHAQFSADPHRFSPYAPSSRVALNVLHADAEGLGLPPADLSALEALELISWPQAAAARIAHLRRVHAAFVAGHLPGLQAAFATFRADGGTALRRHAQFEALHAYHFGADPAHWHWRSWPEALRDPASPAVAAFAAEHAHAVGLHEFLQFLADRGIAAAQRAARASGMGIGLVSDLAVGTDSGGSDSWSRQTEMLIGLSIGAPPDIFNTHGQSWGVTTFSPRGMTEHGYAAFLDMLRSAMRHAGGVRIDHVMGLARLWVIPEGDDPRLGAYLRFPVDDLLRLVALESWRNRAVVLGEDLGTLPHGFRERLSGAGVMGMRVLWFERDGERFIPPRHWSGDAVAMTTTHDLPSVAGWWQGRDIERRAELGLYGEDRNGDGPLRERGRDRHALWGALCEAGAATGDMPPPDAPDPLVQAACAFVGGAACALALLPVEDALALSEQPNLPGTTDEHPNWRRRLPGFADTMLDDPAVAARLAALAAARSA